MEPLQPQQNNKNMFPAKPAMSQPNGSSNIFIQNPNLKTLLLILIGVFLLSGIGLVIFSQFSSTYREKIYQETQAGLPKHRVSESANQQVSNQIATTTTESQAEITTWKTYKNDEYGFEFKYPSNYITTGKKAINSTLGTAQVNVGGIYLGPFVIVPLTSGDLIKEANQYMSFDCGNNTIINGIKINYLDCADGGPAYYGYIHGSKMDFFIDGYSCGWSAEDCSDIYSNGPARYVKKTDIDKILSTFKFTK